MIEETIIIIIIMYNYLTLNFFSYFENSSYVSGLNTCIFVALYVPTFVAGANKVEGAMS